MTRFDRYNEQCKRMKQLEEDGILMVLRPSHKYVKSFEMNTDVLDEAYNAGKNLAKKGLPKLKISSMFSKRNNTTISFLIYYLPESQGTVLCLDFLF